MRILPRISSRGRGHGTRGCNARPSGSGNCVRYTSDRVVSCYAIGIENGRWARSTEFEKFDLHCDRSSAFVTRHLTSGALDPSFAKAGLATPPTDPFLGELEPRAVEVQSNGKILVAGTLHPLGGFPGAGSMFVLRLTTTGALDPSFGASGLRIVDLSAIGVVNSSAAAMAVASDDTFVLAGETRTSGASRFTVVRLTA